MKILLFKEEKDGAKYILWIKGKERGELVKSKNFFDYKLKSIFFSLFLLLRKEKIEIVLKLYLWIYENQQLYIAEVIKTILFNFSYWC